MTMVAARYVESYTETELGNGELNSKENTEVVSDADFMPSEGVISEAPQVPVTMPVRRVLSPTTSSGFSLSRVIRLQHNLSIAQLAILANTIIDSISKGENSVFAVLRMPYNHSRSCEYYVYALRMIVI